MKQIKKQSPFISPTKKVFQSSFKKHHTSHINKNNLFIFQLIKEKLKFPINEKERLLNKYLFYSKCNKIQSIKTLIKFVKQKLQKKYTYNLNFYNIKKINEIICSNNKHIVAKYKDYLIYNNYFEFLQKTYLLKESLELLPQILKYYHCNYVIFPNYVNLSQSKIIYKNILRKQKIIDQYQDLENKKEKIKQGIITVNKTINPIFNTQALDSILNQTDTNGVKAFFGLKNKDSSKNISIENLINKITYAENFQKTKIKNSKIDCTLKKLKAITKSELDDNYKINNLNEIKGRNYNRYIDSGINIVKCNNINKKKNNPGLKLNNTISNGMKNTKIFSITLDKDSKNNNFINQNSNNYIKTYISANHRNNRSNIINLMNYIQKKNLFNNLSNNVKGNKIILFNEILCNSKKGISKHFSENYSTFEQSSSKSKGSIISSTKHIKNLSLLSSSNINNNKIFSYNNKKIQDKNINTNQIHKRILSYNTSNENIMKNGIILSNNKKKKSFIPLTEKNLMNKSEYSSDLINLLTFKLNNCKSNKTSTSSSSLNKKDYNYQNSGVLTSLINNTIRNEIKEIYNKKKKKNKNSNINNIFPCSINIIDRTQKKNQNGNTQNRVLSQKISICNNKISTNFIDDEMIKNNNNTENDYNVYNKNKKYIISLQDINKNKKKVYKGILQNFYSVSINISNNGKKNFIKDLTNKSIKSKRNNTNNYKNMFDSK